MLLARALVSARGLPSSSSFPLTIYNNHRNISMTSAEARVKVTVEQCRSPLTPPSFYTNDNSSNSRPPHHTAKGYKSPWSSANQDGGLLKFARTRLFDWDEKPLPDADALPAVRPASFIPTNTKGNDSGIKFTWLGHACCHFQIPTSSNSKFVSILTDPVFSQRCSPSQSMGPKRYTQPPISILEMAESKVEGVWPDLLVLSHNHYDHLDFDTITLLLSEPNGKPKPHIFCPLGLAQWFKKYLKVQDNEVTELDWWQDRIAVLEKDCKIKLTCVPAQHFSGRSPFDRDQTLWAGWTFEALDQDSSSSSSSSSSRGKNVYFAGDSGYRTVPRGATREEQEKLPYCPAFEEIGQTLGPFDVAAIPIGAYNPRHFMSTVHMDPSDAVCVHQQIQSKKSIGIHWGSFRLTPEDVNEPPQKLKEEVQRAGLDPNAFQVMGNGETMWL